MDSYSLDLHVIHGSLDPHELAPKRHLDRFSRFPQLTHVPNKDIQTDCATCNISNSRPHLIYCVQAMLPNSA